MKEKNITDYQFKESKRWAKSIINAIVQMVKPLSQEDFMNCRFGLLMAIPELIVWCCPDGIPEDLQDILIDKLTRETREAFAKSNKEPHVHDSKDCDCETCQKVSDALGVTKSELFTELNNLNSELLEYYAKNYPPLLLEKDQPTGSMTKEQLKVLIRIANESKEAGTDPKLAVVAYRDQELQKVANGSVN